MSDEIIDLTRYLRTEPASPEPRGVMSLWGADGERSRFALPLWRIVYLAHAERGLIVSRREDPPRPPVPFVALDLASEPARVGVPEGLPSFRGEEEPQLLDLGAGGLVIHLGRHKGTAWSLVVDGGDVRTEPVGPSEREDILFLAGECAGLLFARDLADEEGAGG